MGLQKEDTACSVVSMICLQGLCGAAVVAGVKTVPALAGFNIITHPVQTLQIALALSLTVVIATYALMTALSSYSRPVWQTLGCGLLSLPVGAVVAVLVALAFGAPTSLQSASRTWHWACLMSVLVVGFLPFPLVEYHAAMFSGTIMSQTPCWDLTDVPAAVVLGSSWSEWQRTFAFTRPRGGLELAICVPAHGAALGAWVGAWPMPLDWERPWQEWPVSCTYGAVGGYVLGLAASVLLLLVNWGRIRSKQD